ncbi:MAG: hypothetical protein K9M56_07055 [Victivallales bacterium]|nr:hypothetical protein [Victivallales bacterium]
MAQIAGTTFGSIFFVVIIIIIITLAFLAILTPVFICLINSRVKELLYEQIKSNYNLNEEIQKNNERIDELQKTTFLILSEQKKITSSMNTNTSNQK